MKLSRTHASATLAVALLNFMPMTSADEDLLGIYELAVENDLADRFGDCSQDCTTIGSSSRI